MPTGRGGPGGVVRRTPQANKGKAHTGEGGINGEQPAYKCPFKILGKGSVEKQKLFLHLGLASRSQWASKLP